MRVCVFVSFWIVVFVCMTVQLCPLFYVVKTQRKTHKHESRKKKTYFSLFFPCQWSAFVCYSCHTASIGNGRREKKKQHLDNVISLWVCMFELVIMIWLTCSNGTCLFPSVANKILSKKIWNNKPRRPITTLMNFFSNETEKNRICYECDCWDGSDNTFRETMAKWKKAKSSPWIVTTQSEWWKTFHEPFLS